MLKHSALLWACVLVPHAVRAQPGVSESATMTIETTGSLGNMLNMNFQDQNEMPRTEDAAAEAGWTKLSEACDSVVGIRYRLGDRKYPTLMYDNRGQIAGFQMVLDTVEGSGPVFSMHPSSNLRPIGSSDLDPFWSTTFEESTATATVHFSDPTRICEASERASDDIGDRCWFRLGYDNNQASSFYPLPLDQADIDSNPEYTHGKCVGTGEMTKFFPLLLQGMGKHQWRGPNSVDMDCQDMGSVFGLYSENKLAGFGFHYIENDGTYMANNLTEPNAIFEESPAEIMYETIPEDTRPECLANMNTYDDTLEYGSVVDRTVHHFFTSAYSINCGEGPQSCGQNEYWSHNSQSCKKAKKAGQYCNVVQICEKDYICMDKRCQFKDALAAQCLEENGPDADFCWRCSPTYTNSLECPDCILDAFNEALVTIVNKKQSEWCTENEPQLPVCKAWDLVAPTKQYTLEELEVIELEMVLSREEGGPGFSVPNILAEDEVFNQQAADIEAAAAESEGEETQETSAEVEQLLSILDPEQREAMLKMLPNEGKAVKAVTYANCLDKFCFWSVPSGIDEDYPETADDQGHFPLGASVFDYAQTQLGGAPPMNMYPRWRSLTPWTGDVYDDDSFNSAFFEGLGQQRVQKSQGEVAGAVFAVYFEFTSGLPVKQGFGTYGGDAFFDAYGKVIAIRYRDTMYTKQATKPAAWQALKAIVLGSNIMITTGWDHLATLHFAISNPLVQGYMLMSADHPVRKFLKVHTYNTIGVNRDAKDTLASEYGLFQRMTNLDSDGVRGAFGTAYMDDDIATGKHLYNFSLRVEQRGLATYHRLDIEGASIGVAVPNSDMLGVQLPYEQDGASYFAILHKWVEDYFALFYDTEEACTDDEELQRFYSLFQELSPHPDNVPEFTGCESLVFLMANILFMVTGQHGQVGSIAADMQFPCQMPWSWLEEDFERAMQNLQPRYKDNWLCPPPRALQSANIVMSSTGFDRIFMDQDWSQLLPDESLDAYHAFKSQLNKLKINIRSRNDARRVCGKREYHAFDPTRIETGISV